jgi:O-antigen ligase
MNGLKINVRKLSGNIAVFLFMIYLYGYAQLHVVYPNKYVVIYIFAIILAFSVMSSPLQRPKPIKKQFLAWWLLALMVLINNVVTWSGNFFHINTLRIILCITLMGTLSRKTSWIESWMRITVLLGCIYAVGSLYFYLFPHAYSVMTSFYGFAPAGTNNGIYGYRAGLADQNSQNAIYLVFPILVVVSSFFVKKEDRKKKIVLVGVLLFALLLTIKRAVLMFGIVALCVVYVNMDKQRKTNKMLRLIMLGIVAIVAFTVAAETIPAINDVVLRFSGMGSDVSSQNRLLMWGLAWSLFWRNPIFGIGLWGYQNSYYFNLFSAGTNSLYAALNVHNVYLQVLCEFGIVGMIVYIYAIVTSLYTTFVTLRDIKAKTDNAHYVHTLSLSLVIQVLYILYSLTGNCLYDIVFGFYALALASMYAIRNEIIDLAN